MQDKVWAGQCQSQWQKVYALRRPSPGSVHVCTTRKGQALSPACGKIGISSLGGEAGSATEHVSPEGLAARQVQESF